MDETIIKLLPQYGVIGVMTLVFMGIGKYVMDKLIIILKEYIEIVRENNKNISNILIELKNILTEHTADHKLINQKLDQLNK